MVVAYTATYAAVEVVGGTSPQVGLWLQALLVLVATNHYALAPSQGGAFLPALIVASTYRIIAISLPVTSEALVLRLTATGASTLLSALLARRMVPDIRPPVRAPSRLRQQAAVGATGVPIAFGTWLATTTRVGHAASLTVTPHGVAPTLFLLAALALGAFVEEVVFRGLIQSGARDVSARLAVPVSTVMFAASYAGARPVMYVVVVAMAGFLFSVVRERTGSILGTWTAHTIVNISVISLFPMFTVRH